MTFKHSRKPLKGPAGKTTFPPKMASLLDQISNARLDYDDFVVVSDFCKKPFVEGN